MAGRWLVETVLSQAILFFTGGVEAVQVTNGKSGKIDTFSLIALDPDNRLRYPPVSLFFMMCLCLQIARLVQEKLFDMRLLLESFSTKWTFKGFFISVNKRMLCKIFQILSYFSHNISPPGSTSFTPLSHSGL